jgi:hypothetical protein
MQLVTIHNLPSSQFPTELKAKTNTISNPMKRTLFPLENIYTDHLIIFFHKRGLCVRRFVCDADSQVDGQ